MLHYFQVTYIFWQSICLLNSAWRQGACLWGQSRYLIRIYVSGICIHWAYIATICLINSACRQGVCVCGPSCVFNVSICIYGYCRYRMYILSLFDIYSYVWYTYIYCHYSWVFVKMVLKYEYEQMSQVSGWRELPLSATKERRGLVK